MFTLNLFIHVYLILLTSFATQAFGSSHRVFKVRNYSLPIRKSTEAPVTYGGGSLLSNVHIVPLYWGTHVGYNYDEFYLEVVSSSPFLAILGQYQEKGATVTSGSSDSGIINANGANTGQVSVMSVVNYISNLIDSNNLDPSKGNLYVPVHFSSQVTIVADDGTGVGTGCVDWCAYHYSFFHPKGWVYYGIIAEASAKGCAGGCGNTGTAFGDNCLVASHELAEAITDPDAQQTGWTGAQGEIGDYCTYSGSFCGKDGQLYFVQQIWSNQASGCVAPSVSWCPNGVAKGALQTTTTSKIVTLSISTSAIFPTTFTCIQPTTKQTQCAAATTIITKTSTTITTTTSTVTTTAIATSTKTTTTTATTVKTATTTATSTATVTTTMVATTTKTTTTTSTTVRTATTTATTTATVTTTVVATTTKTTTTTATTVKTATTTATITATTTATVITTSTKTTTFTTTITLTTSNAKSTTQTAV